MASQTLMWTTCPTGIKDGKLQLAVTLSPRIEGDTAVSTLHDFPDMLNWPQTKVTFQVVVEYTKPVRSGQRLRGVVMREMLDATLIGPARDTSLWQGVFGDGSGVAVDSYAFTNVAAQPTRSFSMQAMHSLVLSSHLNLIATSPQSPPTHSQVVAPTTFGPLATIVPLSSYLHGQHAALTAVQTQQAHSLQSLIRTWRAPQIQRGKTVRTAPINGLRFSLRPANPTLQQAQQAYVLEALQYRRPAPATPPPPPPPPKPDFHNIVASLGQYPEIARRVGLTFLLEVAMPSGMPSSGFGNVRVWAVPTWTPTTTQTTNITPKTSVHLTPSIFQAAPRDAAGSDLADRWLTVGDTSAFTVVEIDVDGATLAQAAYTTTLQQDPNADTTPPPLRGAGIGLARGNRSVTLQTQAQISADHNAAMSDPAKVSDPTRGIVLTAEDITRGYRIDVYHQPSGHTTGQWYSLFQRVGAYSFLSSNLHMQFTDEGWVGFSATQDVGATDLNIHELLFRWQGWSLAAPRPGGAVADDGSVPAAADGTPLNTTHTTPPATSPYQVQVTFTPKPGSLPRLRFGDTYKLRARSVDLAGNSLPLNTDSSGVANAETAPIVYGRYDPVTSPVIVPRTLLGPGESPARVVIRSTYDPTTDTYATPTSAERHLLPPHLAPSGAEEHGKFDKIDATGKVIVDPRSYGTILSHEGTLPEGAPSQTIVTPYLPDPLALGATFFGLPHAPATYQPALYGGTWPDISSLRLILGPTSAQAASASLPAVTLPNSTPVSVQSSPITTGALTALLRPGEQVDVRVSSTLDAAGLNLMALWTQVSPRFRNLANGTLVRKLATAGALYAITPYRVVTLTYAVQVPLVPDGTRHLHYDSLLATRYIGQTAAILRGTLAIDGPSTSTYQVAADWTDPIDDPSQPVPGTVAHTATPIKKNVAPDQTSIVFSPVTRIPRLFIGPGTVDTHEFGDTKTHTVQYSGSATTRYGDCFPDGTTPLTRDTAASTVIVPSSTRPATPQVRYAIPTVGWTNQQGLDANNATTLTSQRGGGSLRAYLDRPWYSSGDGELLGVVYYPPQPSQALSGGIRILGSHRIVAPDQLRPYVTQWGTDPVHGGVPTTAPWKAPDEYIDVGYNGPLPIAATTQAVTIAQNASSFVGTATVPSGAKLADLALDEMAGHSDSAGSLNVSVAPYAVAFDADRRLWYADIQLNVGSAHLPFVRLALVRYQPNSISGVELSRVVLADIIQLLPDRTATLTLGETSVAVSVSGHNYATMGDYEVLGGGEFRQLAYHHLLPIFTGTLEQASASTTGSDLQAWTPVSDPLPMPLDPSTAQSDTFVARATFSSLKPGTQYRVVIREYEGAMTDTVRTDHLTVTSRLVYADAIPFTR